MRFIYCSLIFLSQILWATGTDNARTSKKQYFIDDLAQLINKEHQRIFDLRKQILEKRVTDWCDLAKTYREKCLEDRAKLADILLKKIHILPKSMVIAQAILESDWGRSRFAVEGNNLFGIHCKTAKCSGIPARNNPKVRVERFSTHLDSVRRYYHIVNSSKFFSDLREKRFELIYNTQVIKGSVLANYLDRYSAKGKEYNKLIQRIIDVHQLEKFDLN